MNNMNFIKYLNMENPISWDFHRSGWKYVVRNMYENFHNPNGIYLTTHFETLVANKNSLKIPWIGFLHNTPYHPPEMSRYGIFNNSLSDIVKSKTWNESKDYCKGLFVFSEYILEWVNSNMFDKVQTFIHPTELNVLKFNFDQFENSNKKLLFIGHWMRRFESIYELDTKFKKIILAIDRKDLKNLSGNVQVIDWVKDSDYDKFLSESVVFIDLYDSSVNNVVIECIARNTPLLINRFKATEEYLGKDYPFFFNSLSEASSKLNDFQLIKETSNYMSNLDKFKLDINYFMNEFNNCELYKNVNFNKKGTIKII